MATPTRVTFASTPPTAAVIGTLPGTRTLPAVRPPAAGRAGPSRLGRLLRWLVGLLRTGRATAGRLTAQDKRVIAAPIAALLLLAWVYGPTNQDQPAAVETPDVMPTAPAVAGAPSAAPAGGGMVADPTSKGQITRTTAHGLAELRTAFGPAIRGASCWDPHLWNPKSDHPRGRACDVYTSPAGQFAKGDGLVNGNRLAAWLREHHDALGVAYVIWQGRIWSPSKGDRKYGGGGVYDPTDATGGHFDHLHISFRR